MRSLRSLTILTTLGSLRSLTVLTELRNLTVLTTLTATEVIVAVLHQLGSLLLESLGLLQTACCQIIVIALEHAAVCCEHIGCVDIAVGIAVGESPHIIGCTTTLSIGRFHILRQTGIIVQTIGDGGSITQVMVVVQDRVG